MYYFLILHKDLEGEPMSITLYEAVWGRIFAFLYDTAFVLAEKRGLKKIRIELLGLASGKVVELGAGTGLNLAHYPAHVEELLLTEPDPYMAAKLRKRTTSTTLNISIVETLADSLPVESASVDTVVCTLVLCTVPDPERTIQEISRVLRPNGRFIFAEHVRSENRKIAWLQDKLNTSWGWYACGCNCNRDTVATLRDSPLRVIELRKDRLRWISPLVHPLVIGVAGKTK